MIYKPNIQRNQIICFLTPDHRYKYLQKPLEDQSLPGLVQYVGRWEPSHRDKFAMTVGLLMSQGITTGMFLQNLAKDNLVKDSKSLTVLSSLLRALIIIIRHGIERRHYNLSCISC